MESIYIMLLIIVPLSSVWVAMDVAKLRGSGQSADMSPIGWFLGCMLMWIVFFPFYLVKRQGFARTAETAGNKKCPQCAEMVKGDAKMCRYCQHTFPEAGMKSCPKCAGQILNEAVRCKHCGHQFVARTIRRA